MEPDKSVKLESPLIRYSRLSGALAIAAGILVICGWLYDIPPLITFFPGLPPMPATAAFSFILAGISLWLLTLRHTGLIALGQACAALVALISVLTLSEYAFGSDLGIDQLLIPDRTGSSPDPGRIPLAGAISFAVLGPRF
jgi:hypothetical protein